MLITNDLRLHTRKFANKHIAGKLLSCSLNNLAGESDQPDG